MFLGSTFPMNEYEQIVWANITSLHIRDEIQNVVGVSQIITLKINVVMRTQNPPFGTTSSPSSTPTTSAPPELNSTDATFVNRFSGLYLEPWGGGLRRRRRLDQDEINYQVLAVIFDVDVRLRVISPTPSENSGYDVGQFIGGAFNSDNDQQSYVVDLRLTGQPAFFKTISVGLQIPDAAPTPAPTMVDSKSNDVGIIVGVVIAVISLLGMVGYFLYRRRRRRRLYIQQQPPPSSASQLLKEPTRTDSNGSDARSPMPNEFMLNPDDDISTLGDPLPQGMIHEHSREGGSTIGDGMSVPYDFNVQYRSTRDDAVNGSAEFDNIDEELTQDDGTLEAQYLEEEHFEVEGPSGMLGLILGSDLNGVPIVHTIKNTSPLTRVQVGDKLVSVDGQDITTLSSSEASRLISEKRHQPVRRFVFRRSQSSRPCEPINECYHDDYNHVQPPNTCSDSER